MTSKKDSPAIAFLLESKGTPATFQGGQVNDVLYSSTPGAMYPEMNRVSILLQFRSEPAEFQKLVEKLKINSDDDFKKNMAAFASEPKFKATFLQGVPRFSYFEYRNASDGKRIRLAGNELDWDALAAINTLEARAVNSFGRAAPITTLQVKYQ